MTTSEGALSPNTERGVNVLLAVAIQFVVAVTIWGTVGLILDLLLPTAPWLHFAGVLLGVGVGLVLADRRALPPATDEDHHG